MTFDNLEPELEKELERILTSVDESGFGTVVGGYGVKAKELLKRGFLDDMQGDLSNNAVVWVSYKGLSYFDEKERALLKAEASGEWIGPCALSVLQSIARGDFSANDAEEEELAAVARMRRDGLLNVEYADNIPYFISLTDLGQSCLKLDGWMPNMERPQQMNSGNITVINGDVTNSQLQQGSGRFEQTLNVEECPEVVRTLLSLQDNEKLAALFGDKRAEVFAAAEEVSSSTGGARARALAKLGKMLAGFGINLASAGAIELLKTVAGV